MPRDVCEHRAGCWREGVTHPRNGGLDTGECAWEGREETQPNVLFLSVMEIKSLRKQECNCSVARAPGTLCLSVMHALCITQRSWNHRILEMFGRDV